MVSIHRPLGYGPSTLPLRHSAGAKSTMQFYVLMSFIIKSWFWMSENDFFEVLCWFHFSFKQKNHSTIYWVQTFWTQKTRCFCQKTARCQPAPSLAENTAAMQSECVKNPKFECRTYPTSELEHFNVVGRILKTNTDALAGNRTRASRVAGENSTTEPPMHGC